MWRQQWLIWEPSLATEDFVEFSQLIINYPEDKLCLHYEFNSNRRGSLTENAANTSPPLGWKRVKFKNSDEKSSQKTQDSSPKSSQNSRQNPRKRFVNCDGAKTMTVCRVNDWQRQGFGKLKKDWEKSQRRLTYWQQYHFRNNRYITWWHSWW